MSRSPEVQAARDAVQRARSAMVSESFRSGKAHQVRMDALKVQWEAALDALEAASRAAGAAAMPCYDEAFCDAIWIRDGSVRKCPSCTARQVISSGARTSNQENTP